MKKVFVIKGKWRDTEIVNTEFNMVSDDVKMGRNGLYITVEKGDIISNSKNIRIYIDTPDDIAFAGVKTDMEDHSNTVKHEYIEETDEEVINRINDRFSVLSDMTFAANDSIIRGLIVGGAPGVGKSYTVEKVLTENGVETEDFEIVKGTISAIGLYKKLYDFRKEGQVLVFDDCDNVFFDQTSLALLKAALDSSNIRRMAWNTNSMDLENNDIPKTFEFEGAVIFITNMDLDNTKSKQLKPHFDALISRTHYLDLTIKSDRDKLLRIKGLVKDSDMLDTYGFNDNVKDEILNFMTENMDNLRELSLRTTIKIADIARMKPSDWKRVCKMTVCK